MNIRDALTWGGKSLSSLDGGSPRLDAEILLAFVIEKPRSHLHAWPERELPPEHWHRFQELIGQRLNGRPLAYITGRREFWSLELAVTKAVLIPRPETELLVERALELLPLGHAALIADLGTGSGAIAAALARERPEARIVAVDSSPEALAVAEGNLRRLGLANVETRLGNWCNGFREDERYDLILSNPPYIADDDPHLNRGDLPAEPRSALASGPDGLDDIRAILCCVPSRLKPGGWLLVEHGYDQGERVRGLFLQAGFTQVATLRDLEERERVTEGQLPHPAWTDPGSNAR
ncbi:MAG: peptide chain release factor N(5)-glutamine methyltransferase [Gammaproteobacteria bacterium]|nr:peptide chain release factor N(5)-glutamine methyltransferase [Gammaproteobacteria bacterium]MBU1653314.1 peptide chain release factor N(5)-glutamine methyltransferase [Gammaproteobacteria bacterium]MBU1961068.1 peptide chain release factor N(5)-glutamine methyltransferase [Gammaproteobacteria bacterium]